VGSIYRKAVVVVGWESVKKAPGPTQRALRGQRANELHHIGGEDTSTVGASR
jgi:hypothetical protein